MKQVSYYVCDDWSVTMFISGYANTVMTSRRRLTPEFALGASGKF